MNLRFFLFLIILITNEVGQAQNTIPSLARVTEYLSPVPDFTPLATLNPALQYYHYEYSYTELSLTGNYRKADRAQIMQEGNGWKGFHIQARSWNKLNNNSCVWGEALYQNGRTANVRWNETSDFQTVYPYIMADTIGGDLQSETYRFQGGYARDHRHFTWGAVLAYKAIMEYRKKTHVPATSFRTWISKLESHGKSVEIMSLVLLSGPANTSRPTTSDFSANWEYTKSIT